jgi:glycosyltransferase involved in cell wall biosynthesis
MIPRSYAPDSRSGHKDPVSIPKEKFVMELSIVMPCLNEAKTLPVCLQKAFEYLRVSGVDGEVVVADNGSTDGSVEIAEQAGARVVHVTGKGYGAALSSGIHEAHGRYVIMGDSDASYDFLGLQPFVDKLREGYDLVMGNRFAGGISKGAMPFMHRFVGNPMLSALGRRIYGHKVCGDFYCGLRGFRKQAIESLRIQSTGMEFALEMLIKAELYQLKIAEVPTTLRPDGRDRKPHLKTYRDGWRSLRLYLLMSPRWTFGIPGLVMMLVGVLALFALGLGLAAGAWATFCLVASVVCLVLGYQGALLAIFAKFVAIEVGLHPPATKFWMLRDRRTLERFLVTGLILSVLSLIAAISLTLGAGDMVQFSFGDFSNMQLAIVAGLFLILGGQTMLAGFYFGILHLITERRQFPRKRRSDHSKDHATDPRPTSHSPPENPCSHPTFRFGRLSNRKDSECSVTANWASAKLIKSSPRCLSRCFTGCGTLYWTNWCPVSSSPGRRTISPIFWLFFLVFKFRLLVCAGRTCLRSHREFWRVIVLYSRTF